MWRQDTSAAAKPGAKLSRTGLRWALEGIVVQHLTVARVAERSDVWRDGVEVVAMDGISGFKAAAAEEVPDAVAVMVPFYVVRLAGDVLDRWRRRIQLAIHGHRGLKDAPLCKSLRTLHTSPDLLADKQTRRLRAFFADDHRVEAEATWGIYQRMIVAYRHQDRRRGHVLMAKLITDLNSGVPKGLTELITLGRTLKKRAADVLASTDPARPTARQRPSTGALNTSADPHSASGI